MCNKLNLSSWPADHDKATELIEKWLADKDESVPDITPLLLNFTNTQKHSTGTLEAPSNLPRAKNYYYGVEGKREAVLQFFNLVLNTESKQTLFLSSEEDIGWLYENPAFAAKWSQDFTKVLMAGNRVKIIHSIGRGMNEMLEAAAKWLPIYSTGMIEPYFYPKIRDGIFQRTLFIAPETAAIVSVSVDRKTENMLNELITDKEAIAALLLEFEHYFSLCRPLMHILTAERREELWKVYNTLIDTDGNMICMSDMPTLATMPKKVAEAMQERAPKSYILEQWKNVTDFINSLTDETPYIEILPSIRNKECAEAVPLPCADLLGAPGLCYTDDEWHAHIDNTMHFAENHPGYKQYKKADIPKNICLFVKEGHGVISMRNAAPGIAFAFSETALVNAFWSYLTREIMPY